MRKMFEWLVAAVGGTAMFGFVAVMIPASTLGWAYWMWMAIKLGSFGMFFFGILGPLAAVAGILGLWSFLFGLPKWLFMLVT